MFKPHLKKKSFRWRRQTHCVPNIAHFKLSLWSDERSVSGKSFNAVSLGVPSTWPLKYAHMVIIYSTESSMLYFFNILLFHVQKLFNFFSKYVWLFVAHFCMNSFSFTHDTKKISSKCQVEQIPITRAAGTQTLNVKLIK
jgi:hypothetical protein